VIGSDHQQKTKQKKPDELIKSGNDPKIREISPKSFRETTVGKIYRK